MAALTFLLHPRLIHALFYFSVCLLTSPGMGTASEVKTLNLLFIGNSYTQQHNIPDQVRDFLERGDAGLKVQTMRVIYGGSQAERHWNNYGTANLLNLAGLGRKDLEEQQQRMGREAAELQKIIDQGRAENRAPDRRTERYLGHFRTAG